MSTNLGRVDKEKAVAKKETEKAQRDALSRSISLQLHHRDLGNELAVLNDAISNAETVNASQEMRATLGGLLQAADDTRLHKAEQAFRNELSDLQNRLKMSSDSHANVTAAFQELKGVERELRVHYGASKDDHLKLQARYSSLVEHCRTVERERDEAKATVDNLQTELHTLKICHGTLDQETKAAHVERDDAQASLRKLQTTYNNVIERLRAAQDEIDALESQLSKLQSDAELHDLELERHTLDFDQHFVAESNIWKQGLHQIREDFQQANDERLRLSFLCEDQELIIHRLRQDLNQALLDKDVARQHHLEARITAGDTITSLEAELDSLTAQIDTIQRERVEKQTDLQREHLDLNIDVLGMQKQMVAQKRSLLGLRCQNKQLLGSRAQILVQLQSLEDAYERRDSEAIIFAAACRRDLSVLQGEASQLQSDRAASSERISAQDKTIAILEAEVKSFSGALVEANKAGKDLQQRLDAEIASGLELEQCLQKLDRQVCSQEREMATKDQTLARLESQEERLSTALADAESKAQITSKDILNLQDKLEEATSTIQGHETALHTLQFRVREGEERILSGNQTLKSSVSRILQLSDEVFEAKRAESGFRAQVQELEEVALVYDEALENAESRAVELSNELGESKSNAQVALDDLDMKLSAAEATIHSHERAKSHLRHQVKDLEEVNSSQAQAVNELKSHTARLASELKGVSSDAQLTSNDLKTKLAGAEAAILVHQRAESELELQNSELEHWNDELRQHNSSLHDRLYNASQSAEVFKKKYQWAKDFAGRMMPSPRKRVAAADEPSDAARQNKHKRL